MPTSKGALLVSRGVAGQYACAILYDSVALIHVLEVPDQTETTGGSALCTGSFSRRPLLGYRLTFQDQKGRSFLLDVAVRMLTCGECASVQGGIT